ncbi:MAG: hypothetical protein OXG72_01905 [Acidobacteria bacterium]|nr:hypothetical protein [Acidobacteriota bacterium]
MTSTVATPAQAGVGDATPPDDASLTWLTAAWVGLKELEDEHPQVCTDGWPTRARIEYCGQLIVEIYCVERWHRGDEDALYCDDFKTDDPPLRWRGSADETLAALDDETRGGHGDIRHDPADAPNPNPSLRWKSAMREEEEYVHKDIETDETIVDEHGNATYDNERLEMDAHDAASYTGPAIPDGTDMDAVVKAGYNEIAIRTTRGQLWELCSIGGTILWDDYRAS